MLVPQAMAYAMLAGLPPQVSLDASIAPLIRFKRHEGILAIRVDKSLHFANAPYLRSHVMERIANRPDVRSVLLISSGINDIDATGLESIESIKRDLGDSGIVLYMSDVKGPVIDRFKLAGFDKQFLENHIFISADMAIRYLERKNPNSDARNDSTVSDEPAATGV